MAKILWDQPEVEYVDGHPYSKVSPKRTHAVVQLAVAMILQRCAGKRGIVGPEWRFKLAVGTELVPDIAYVSYERLRPLSDAEAEEPPFAPDIAAEVRSPSHRRGLAAKKVQKYLSYGGVLILDIDPFARVMHVYTNVSGSPSTYHAGEQFVSESFPWLRFDIDELFSNIDIPR